MVMPEPEPRGEYAGVAAVWIVAALAGIAIGIFAPAEWRGAWMTVGFGGSVILAFAVQLGFGRPDRFIVRVAASVLGALVVLGLIALGFALATIVPA